MRIDEQLARITSVGAGWVMWLLIGLSVLGLGIILERAVQLVASRDDVRALRGDMAALLSGGDAAAARRRLSESASYEARVAMAGLEVVEKGPAAVEQRMSGESQLARLAMEKNLSFLATVGSNAPFVGLLGTVIGIVRAFRALQSGGGQISSQLMSEVGEALVATALGLLVALPAIAFYNLFQRIISARLARADALGREVLAFAHGSR